MTDSPTARPVRAVHRHRERGAGARERDVLRPGTEGFHTVRLINISSADIVVNLVTMQSFPFSKLEFYL